MLAATPYLIAEAEGLTAAFAESDERPSSTKNSAESDPNSLKVRFYNSLYQQQLGEEDVALWQLDYMRGRSRKGSPLEAMSSLRAARFVVPRAMAEQGYPWDEVYCFDVLELDSRGPQGDYYQIEYGRVATMMWRRGGDEVDRLASVVDVFDFEGNTPNRSDCTKLLLPGDTTISDLSLICGAASEIMAELEQVTTEQLHTV